MSLLVFLLVGSLSLTEAVNLYKNPFEYLGNEKTFLGADTCDDSRINLDLSGLGIAYVLGSTFAYCENLTTLDLSNNWIKKLPDGFFANETPNVEHISLANNDLGGKGWKGAFRGLTKLKSLNITHNPLSTILNDENFAGLPGSCEIHVSQSKNFRTITPLAFGRPKKLAKKNHTPANESRNCPHSLSDQMEMFEVDRWRMFRSIISERRKLDNEPYSDDEVKMCTNNTTVGFVDFSNVTETLSSNCHKILINGNKTKLKIYDNTIASFDSRWFRIRNTSLKAIYLYPKTFENLTSDLLNDLPENIRFFSLQKSDLQSLRKGVMVNEHLRGLDLSTNFIRFIEEGAFARMNLTCLNLGYNPLVTLDCVPTLPETLLWLNLDSTAVLEIPGKTFSRLKNLLALSLSGNRIMELQPPGLDGLVSLQWLDLGGTETKNLRPGVFRDLRRLYSIDLSINHIETLDEGVFNGMGCLAKLDLSWNRLSGVGRGVFAGLADSLEELNLRANKFEILEAGSFVGVPKYNLSLMENGIRKIEKDAFDLPYLRYLDLRNNNLTTIEKGAVKSLGNLAEKTEIRLGFNPIERLENGALAGVSSKARVSLAGNRIKVIQAGVFDDS